MRIAHSAYIAAGERFPDSRAAPRYPMAAPAEIIEPLSKSIVNGSIAVISTIGCYFRAEDTPTAGTVVRLRIEREGNTFETWAQIAHVSPGEGIGLAFFDMAQPQMELLSQWIAELAQPANKQ